MLKGFKIDKDIIAFDKDIIAIDFQNQDVLVN